MICKRPFTAFQKHSSCPPTDVANVAAVAWIPPNRYTGVAPFTPLVANTTGWSADDVMAPSTHTQKPPVQVS